MPLAAIRQLTPADADQLHGLIQGYSSATRYEVSRVETPDSVRFELRLVELAEPFTKRYPSLDAAHLREMAAMGHSFGVFTAEECVGLALGEPQAWNATFIIHELHIAAPRQRQGLGRALMTAVFHEAEVVGVRCVVCETQATNVPAIHFYQAMGFTLDGLDVSLYTNEDLDRGEVAFFMKKRLPSAPGAKE